MNRKTWTAVLMAAAMAVGCGGGGGGSGGISPAGSGGSKVDPGTIRKSETATSNNSGSMLLTLSNATISASLPGTVTAVVTDTKNQPVANVLVTFGLSGTASPIGQVAPATALTDTQGQASTTLMPASGATSGAAYVTASADYGPSPLLAKAGFTVTSTAVRLNPVTVSPASITAYGSAAVNIALVDSNGNPAQFLNLSPVTVNVSSTCAAAGKAVISPASLSLTTANSSVTYQDKGCGTTDRINVQIAGTTQQQAADLTIVPPVTTGIQFVQSDLPTICLTGSGCPNSATVTFKVVNSSGVGQAGVPVDFSLDPSVSQYAVLGATGGTTAADGTVFVTVTSKSTPTPLRVTAIVRGSSPVIQTVSNVLTISGGLPVAGNSLQTNGISLAASKINLDYNLDGDSTQLTVRLTDEYHQAAIDGTGVIFVSDYGTLMPAHCTTTNGSCSVNLVVSNPRPADGRVHVVAYASGQEYFVDSNSNGVKDSADTVFDDVPTGVCVDSNENGICDSGEFILGNSNAGNGAWDGPGAALARDNYTLIFSYTGVKPRLFALAANGSCSSTAVTSSAPLSVTMGSSALQSVGFCVRDGDLNGQANNPIAGGSDLSAVTTLANVTASVNPPQASGTAFLPTIHTLKVMNALAPNAVSSSGKADITIVTGGLTYTFSNVVDILP